MADMWGEKTTVMTFDQILLQMKALKSELIAWSNTKNTEVAIYVTIRSPVDGQLILDGDLTLNNIDAVTEQLLAVMK